MENSTKFNLKQEALKNGLIWGAINIVLFLVGWYAMPEALGKTWFYILQLAIGIVLAVYFCKDLRTKAGGYWTFSEALWPIFVTFILTGIVYYIFPIVFGKYIDTNYPIKMREIIVEQSAAIFESLGIDESQMEEVMAKQEEQIEAQFNPSLSQAISGFGLTSIFYFLGALIFAAIFKRSDPNPWKDVLEEENNANS